MSPQTALLLLFESLLVTISLALSLHAYLDTCRSTLWQYGGSQGWNSNPHDRVYDVANYREPPDIPRIWSAALTESNLAIVGVSVVAAGVRGVVGWYARLRGKMESAPKPKFTQELPHPDTSMHAPVYLILFDMLLLTLWSFSLYGQTSADYSDPNHPSRWPWYVTRKCSRRLLPSDLELGGGLDEEEWRCCVLAKVFLGVSGNLLVLYAARLVWCVYKTITCGWKKKTSTSRIKSRIADKPRTQKNRPDHGPKDEETGK